MGRGGTAYARAFDLLLFSGDEGFEFPPSTVPLYAHQPNPFVAVILGWALVDETLNGRTGIAAALVVFGVMLLVCPRSSNADKSQKSPLGNQPATTGEKEDERQSHRASAD